MRKLFRYFILFEIFVVSLQFVNAQNGLSLKERKAWEIGIGGSVWQFNRMSFSNFQKTVEGDYTYDMKNRHAVWGGQLYVARELNSHFYLDLQGNLGATDKTLNGKTGWLGMAGLGLQWRLGEYFKSPYIDPFLRVGANYMYKGFDIHYAGDESIGTDQMQWIMENHDNKDGNDRTNMFVASFGGGVNMWLNDRFGVGLQADYLLMPYKNVANSVQGTVRLMWRFGGKPKNPRPKTVVEYVDRPVEKIVERIVEKEKVVMVPAEVQSNITNDLVALFDQIYFDFDKDVLTTESETILDEIAKTLKTDTSRRFLVTGQTDARGSESYNADLSLRRARKVVGGLVARGVPAEMLKYRGVGKKIAAIPYEGADNTRRGDRKITIELVTNMDYWNSGAFLQPEPSGSDSASTGDAPHYSIQILASATPVSSDSREFKGREAVQYKVRGKFPYKYCIGHFTDRKVAQTELNSVARDFPGAYIVTIRNGQIEP